MHRIPKNLRFSQERSFSKFFIPKKNIRFWRQILK